MNAIEIALPSRAIAGDYAVTIVPIVPYAEPKDSKDYMVIGLPSGYFNIHNMLIQEGYGDVILSNLRSGSDLVVSIYSQKGGLSASASDSFDHHHMAATTQDVATCVTELLNADMDSSNLFDTGFPVIE